jgi:hypothetical protein
VFDSPARGDALEVVEPALKLEHLRQRRAYVGLEVAKHAEDDETSQGLVVARGELKKRGPSDLSCGKLSAGFNGTLAAVAGSASTLVRTGTACENRTARLVIRSASLLNAA